MRDHVTEELISAYADGELEGDELKFVEGLLAESAEYRQLLAEFESLRASMWALPSYKLPANLPARVKARVDDRAVSPAKEPVRRARGRAKARSLASVAFAAASLAAVVVFTVMLRPVTPESPLPTVLGPSQVFPVFFQDIPRYVMIYDVTVTPAGQKKQAIDRLREKLGIGIDPALRLSKQLEKNLKVIRESKRGGVDAVTAPYEEDPATPKSTEKDKVEMIYISGKLNVLDRFGREMEAMSAVGEDVSTLHYDLAIEPRKLGVMHRLHDAAREHFARNSNSAPADEGLAFRLAFDVELTSLSVPGAATFPVPRVLADEGLPANEEGSAYILLIIRNAGAN
jgi:hypothetical protein